MHDELGTDVSLFQGEGDGELYLYQLYCKF